MYHSSLWGSPQFPRSLHIRGLLRAMRLCLKRPVVQKVNRVSIVLECCQVGPHWPATILYGFAYRASASDPDPSGKEAIVLAALCADVCWPGGASPAVLSEVVGAVGKPKAGNQLAEILLNASPHITSSPPSWSILMLFM